MSESMIQEVVKASPNRRKFLKVLGVASAAVGAMSVGAVSAEAQSTTEIDVLNFALNLEYLEAEFYTYGQYGYGIEKFGIGVSGVANGRSSRDGGTTTGGKMVDFTDDQIFSKEITAEIGTDERAHVVLLRSFLGRQAIAKPDLNLTALGFGFDTEKDFIELAHIFETIGVSAYAGAAYLLTTPLVIQTAARILAVEALHTGSLNTQVAKLSIASPKLDGADLVPPRTGPQTQYLPVNTANGLPALRTVPQVLNLAYGGAGLTRGGFFPNGVNGAFSTTASSQPATAANLDTQPGGFA